MMYQFRLDDRSVQRSPLHSLRVQILWILATAFALPLTAFVLLRGTAPLNLSSTYFTVALSLIAASVTLLTLRQVGSFYGLALSKWVLPTYVFSWASAFGVLAFLRIPFSSTLLGFSFVISLVSFFMLTRLMARTRKAICYLVPLGRAAELDFTPRMPVIRLDRPHLPPEGNAIVVADMHADLGDEWERTLTEAALNGNPIYHIAQLREATTGQVQFNHLSENSFGALIPALAYNKIKRFLDTLASIILLPLLLPIILIVALAIKLDSPGPALFLQKRVGYRGRLFNMVKFRTMTVTENGDERTASITNHNDQRITRLGRFLRPTRIDELPQVFNILAGQMSWIGPRPEAASLSRDYSNEIANYRYRHLVRPGITGWAQIHQGHVTSVEDVRNKLRYDFYYVKNISLWLDIVIALATLQVIFTRFGAK